MIERKLYDWLIVVFLHEVQNDKTFSDQMIEAIRQAGASDGIAIFLVRDAVGTDPVTRLNTFQLSASRLEKNPAGNWEYIPIDQAKLKIDNTKKNCWEQAFRYIYNNYTGGRNILITYSEGATLGFNFEPVRTERPPLPPRPAPQGYIDLVMDPMLPVMMKEAGFAELPAAAVTNQYYVFDEEEMKELVTNPGFAPLPANLKKEGDVWLLKRDPNETICKNLEILWVSQLEDALARCLYGRNIDILLMTNCFMQLFDNGYTLSNKVKYLVGAEGPMSMEGYDWGSLITLLNQQPGTPSKTLATQICTDLQKMYARKGETMTLASATIFANRLKFYPMALRIFLDMLKDLKPLLLETAVVQKLVEIRGLMKNVSTYPKYPLVDAGLWITLVTQQIPQLTNAAYYHKMFSQLQSKILVKDTISAISHLQDQNSVQKYGYSGISLYYPADNKMHEDQEVLFCAYFDKAVPQPFRTTSKWNEFLDAYFKAVAKLNTPAPAPTAPAPIPGRAPSPERAAQ
jgi:hypothetical protein